MSAVNPPGGSAACLINSEIVRVLGVMRRNVRWGFYPAPEDQAEHPLIRSLNELRSQVFLWAPDGWHLVDPSAYLRPFMDVIQSDETGAPITGAALSSVLKILTLDMLDPGGPHTEAAMNLIVQSVMSCRFEVTDPASEELVLTKILQILLACLRTPASVRLTNHHVCHMVNTCFRIVHQATSKAELLQRISRHTMHEIVRSVFLRLPTLPPDHDPSAPRASRGGGEGVVELGSVNGNRDNNMVSEQNEVGVGGRAVITAMGEPYGVPCMVEILHFLCSLLNVIEHVGVDSQPDPMAYDEDVPLFALGLINCAVEVGGSSFMAHPSLLTLVQTDVFRNVMLFGASSSPLILSTVCTIILNMFHHLRHVLKPQLESFFSTVLLRVARSKVGGHFQLHEVAMEALVDLCQLPFFAVEVYVNFDCDVSSGNVLEEVVGLLSRNAFPVNTPLSALHLLSLRGLLFLLRGISDRAESWPVESLSGEEFCWESGGESFWVGRCRDYGDPECWVPFVRGMKCVKKKLMVGADHFNRDPKKGFEYLRAARLLPDEPDPGSVARFLRHTYGLEKNAVGDFLGNHDGFSVQVLDEFARTFDFRSMKLDGALRVFLDKFRLPGESQKIQRVLEAFAGRFFEQSPHIFKDRDAALLLSYSIILLNTDRHNVQVKKKMTEEDFIRNNRRINGGDDLPREYLSELYRSICDNEIRMAPDMGSGYTPKSGLFHVQNEEDGVPYISCQSESWFDRDMFVILSGPAIAAICVVFENVTREGALRLCVDGFLSIAKLSSCYGLHQVLDDLVVSLCRFTNLVGPSPEVDHEPLGGDTKAAMATSSVFTVAVRYGDHIRTGWNNVLDCILTLHRLHLLPDLLSEGDDEVVLTRRHPDRAQVQPGSKPAPSLIGRFSQLLSFDGEERPDEPSDGDLVSFREALSRIRSCHIDSIFTESGSLGAESLMCLLRALMAESGGGSEEDDDTVAFFLELIVALVISNRERINLVWREVFEHISGIVHSITAPCQVAEKVVFGLLRMCQRLVSYEEEVLGSLQLILKLDARVADAYCEQITEEVRHLVEENASGIRSGAGWRAVISLLSITARHPEASEPGFKTLTFVMTRGYLSPANYAYCVEAAGEFVESWVGDVGRSILALDLMAGAACVREGAEAGEMLIRVVRGAKKGCVDRRVEVREKAVVVMQGCLTQTVRNLPEGILEGCFEQGIFPMMDGLLEVTHGGLWKEYGDVEGTVVSGMRLMVRVFVQVAEDDSVESGCVGRLLAGVVPRVERCVGARFRGRKSGKVVEEVPGLVKGVVAALKERDGVLDGGDSIWNSLKDVVPSLRDVLWEVAVVRDDSNAPAEGIIEVGRI